MALTFSFFSFVVFLAFSKTSHACVEGRSTSVVKDDSYVFLACVNGKTEYPDLREFIAFVDEQGPSPRIQAGLLKVSGSSSFSEVRKKLAGGLGKSPHALIAAKSSDFGEIHAATVVANAYAAWKSEQVKGPVTALMDAVPRVQQEIKSLKNMSCRSTDLPPMTHYKLVTSKGKAIVFYPTRTERTASLVNLAENLAIEGFWGVATGTSPEKYNVDYSRSETYRFVYSKSTGKMMISGSDGVVEIVNFQRLDSSLVSNTCLSVQASLRATSSGGGSVNKSSSGLGEGA